MDGQLLIGVVQPHAFAVMILTVVALFMFAREQIPLQTSSLFVLVALIAVFHLFPFIQEDGSLLEAKIFFQGFANEALIAVCALMVAGQAMVRTGAMEPIGRFLARIWKVYPSISLLLTLVIGATLSAFVNNTPIVVLLLPVLINVSARTGTSSTGTLLPMGLATILGGMATTIGTSTNLLVISVAEEMGMPTFGMFDFALPVVMVGIVAVIYLWLIAPHMIPPREAVLKNISVRAYAAELLVKEGGFAAGKHLAELRQQVHGQLKVQRIIRGEASITALPDVELKAGDKLFVSDTPFALREFETALDLDLVSSEESNIQGPSELMVELVITPQSALERMRLGDVRLSSKYGLKLLAVNSHGEERLAQSKGLSDLVLVAGDVLLVEGSIQSINLLKSSRDVLVLDGREELPYTKKAPLALMIMVGIVGVAAMDLIPIYLSSVIGCFLLLITNCLKWRDVTQALSMQVVLIIVASLALGTALMATGAADFLADRFVLITHGASPAVILGSLMFVMGVFTNVISNNAAAVIGTPIAISLAQRLGMPVEPFILAVLFGSNLSFATPIAYKTNLLVMNAGGYQFKDFMKVGIPLFVIIWIMLTIILSWVYQLW
ncbi:SLC13 family permease [Marinicella rhabdoformis]|uniref:SLC13 family permease n=1 Tax=Marinicella rhabdoformis TaxID=2580566 RepID=UPI0012AEC311|nr:SLC13 family permease [Marinicella rhabdoformis]